MTGVDKFKAGVDAAVTMAKIISDHYDEIKAAGMDVMRLAEDMKKFIAFCQAQKRAGKQINEKL